MKPFLLPPVVGNVVGQTELTILGSVTSTGEGKPELCCLKNLCYTGAPFYYYHPQSVNGSMQIFTTKNKTPVETV